MKRKILVILGLVAFLGVGLTGYATATQHEIGATVTPGLVAVSVDDGSVVYGTVNLSAAKNTVAFHGTDNPDGGAAGTQTVTNDGTIPANLLLASSDAVGDTVDWNLVACGSVGTDAYGHEFELNNGDAFFDGTTFNLSTLAADTGLDLAGSASATLDIGICMPSGTTDSTEHDITITATVTAA
ncbi:MAG: hypothetical protein V3S20_07310 [Dehalococcoidia bacterium]